MSDGPRSELLLRLVSDGVEIDEAAQKLLGVGNDLGALGDVERFLHALDADPSARDRALLLVERTRLLAERGNAGAERSDQLRADAAQLRPGGDRPDPGPEGDSPVLRHELSTPITVARSAVELLALDGNDAATSEELIGLALRSLRYAGRLLETWGRAEHLQQGRTELSWAQVDLGELVRECVADVRAVLIGRHELSVDRERTVSVPADPDAVRQILFNLLTNAAKFSPDGSRIELSVSTTDTHAEVVVRDRGAGIPPQDVARIFDAGRRVARAAAPGMGLGLFVARQLARAHDGDLHVENASPGSRFVLRLPLSSAQWQASLERREEAIASHEGHHRDRSAVADARDAELDEREDVADQRDAALTSREALARQRDASLERRDEG